MSEAQDEALRSPAEELWREMADDYGELRRYGRPDFINRMIEFGRASKLEGERAGLERAAEWHNESARVALEKGMGAHSVAYCEGWVQAHSESASRLRALLPSPEAPRE